MDQACERVARRRIVFTRGRAVVKLCARDDLLNLAREVAANRQQVFGARFAKIQLVQFAGLCPFSQAVR